jgi:hypothetical protein
MTYDEALQQLIENNVKIGISPYPIQTNNEGYGAGARVLTPFMLINITIAPENKIGEVMGEISKHSSNEEALKRLGLFNNSDLEIKLTFHYDGFPQQELTMKKYLNYRKFYLP